LGLGCIVRRYAGVFFWCLLFFCGGFLFGGSLGRSILGCVFGFYCICRFFCLLGSSLIARYGRGRLWSLGFLSRLLGADLFLLLTFLALIFSHGGPHVSAIQP
jgi:hypothetical protein